MHPFHAQTFFFVCVSHRDYNSIGNFVKKEVKNSIVYLMCDNIRHAHPSSDNQAITWFAIILQIFGNDTRYSMT